MAMTTKLRVSFDATIVTTDKEFEQLVAIVKTGKADHVVGGQKVLDHMTALLADHESTDVNDEAALRLTKDALVEFAYKTVWRKAIRALLLSECDGLHARFSPVKVEAI